VANLYATREKGSDGGGVPKEPPLGLPPHKGGKPTCPTGPGFSGSPTFRGYKIPGARRPTRDGSFQAYPAALHCSTPFPSQWVEI